ncbi:hypothetical protein GCM10029978_097540 [Actinoallomurus acanthiterrae]
MCSTASRRLALTSTLTSSSLITLYPQIPFAVLVEQEFLKAVGADVDERPTPLFAAHRQLDLRPLTGFFRPVQHLTQGILHDRVETPAMLGCERLGVRKELIVDPHRRPPHAFSVGSMT